MYPKLVTIAAIVLVLMVLPPALTLRYTVHNTKVIYFEALTQCMKKGGALASIETPYQQTQLWNAVKKAGGPTPDTYWISGTDLGIEGSWMWLPRNLPVGTIRGWTNWNDGEPNNVNNAEHCLSFVGSRNGLWADVPCEDQYFYLCEYAD